MMLADSCEAAARSLARPDPENIRSIVSKIFDASSATANSTNATYRSRIDDDQGINDRLARRHLPLAR
jgi:hypothetical protein